MYMFIEKKPTPAVYLSYIKIEFTGYLRKLTLLLVHVTADVYTGIINLWVGLP